MSSSNTPTWQWVEHAVVVVGALYLGKKLLVDNGGLKANATRLAIRAARSLPGASSILEKQEREALDAINELVFAHEPKHMPGLRQLPESGVSPEELLQQLGKCREEELDYRDGKAFGGIYNNDEELEDLLRDVCRLYLDSNALYPSIFPGLRKFEAEVIRMTLSLLHGDEQSVGNMTSGGTESILMAMKTYRDRGAEEFGITKPRIVMPSSAHAAFVKGAHYFGYDMVVVGEGEDCRADVTQLAAAIDDNTVMVVASAPSFPHGVIDPIEEIAALLTDRPQTGLHIDCCLGGFVLPFLSQLGRLEKKFDFLVPEVTSISVDFHKYGFSTKGTSAIFYRNKELRKHQYFTYVDWNGGLYCSPSLQGSRAGAPIACTYSILRYMGASGYRAGIARMQDTFQVIVEGINAIPGLRVLGPPDTCCIAYVSDDASLDIYKVADAVSKFRWSVNRIQKPKALHMQVASRADFDHIQFLADLRTAVEDVRANPDKFQGGMAGIYGLAATLAEGGEDSLVSNLLGGYMDALMAVKQ